MALSAIILATLVALAASQKSEKVVVGFYSEALCPGCDQLAESTMNQAVKEVRRVWSEFLTSNTSTGISRPRSRQKTAGISPRPDVTGWKMITECAHSLHRVLKTSDIATYFRTRKRVRCTRRVTISKVTKLIQAIPIDNKNIQKYKMWRAKFPNSFSHTVVQLSHRWVVSKNVSVTEKHRFLVINCYCRMGSSIVSWQDTTARGVAGTDPKKWVLISFWSCHLSWFFKIWKLHCNVLLYIFLSFYPHSTFKCNKWYDSIKYWIR